MTRSTSSCGSRKTSTDPQSPNMPTQTKQISKSSMPTTPRSPRNSANRLWILEQQKRSFLLHLGQWALDHDSSLHFQGKLSLVAPNAEGPWHLELGKPVKCILSDTTFTDARRIIVIKLFPPQNCASVKNCNEGETRRDSMELIESRPKSQQRRTRTRVSKSGCRQDSTSNARGFYKLVVRCGAGWMSSREFFSKLYISRLEVQNTHPERLQHDRHLVRRSQALGAFPKDEDSVTIRPLFHAFQRLPAELKELVLMTAAGLARSYNLRSDDYGTLIPRRKDCAAISLSTLFRISKNITDHLQPHIYHSTDFHFGLTGFTNFLWQSGPRKRHQIRRLTFHFGKLALLHCIRWLAPDTIFLLFEPPVATNPRSLQYFWRCQIQDLVKDVHLLTLTIDTKQIAKSELPMMIAVMKSAFGTIEKLKFVETDNNGVSRPVELDDERLSGLKKMHTWEQMCMDYYHTHRAHSYFFKFELLKGQAEDLENAMAKDTTFFDTPFSPLGARKDFPISME